MKTKFSHPLAFCVYTLAIYLLSLFIVCLLALPRYGIHEVAGNLKNFVLALCSGIASFYLPDNVLSEHAPMLLLMIVFITLCLFLYGLPFIFWRRKPTLPRAFLLSFLGFLLGPGSMFTDFFDWQFEQIKERIFFIMCLFYLALFICDWLRKKKLS